MMQRFKDADRQKNCAGKTVRLTAEILDKNERVVAENTVPVTRPRGRDGDHRRSDP